MTEQTEEQRQAEERRQDEQRQAEERRREDQRQEEQRRQDEQRRQAQTRAQGEQVRQQEAPLRERPADERPRDESTIDRQELLRREQTPPPPEAKQPAPLLVMDPVLRDSLEALDRDVSGEIRFCRQAADALRSFQYRWSTDAPVEDGYGKAIQALENLDSILRGAEIRTTEEVTRKVLGRLGATQHARKAEAAREHAVQWGDTPVPPDSAARQEERAKRPVPPEAGVVA